MKQALCLKDINDFNRISDGEIPTIDFSFVDRAICEIPSNGYFQLIPYVSFNFLDVAKGKLNFVIYTRPSKGEGEARLQGNSSIGFGGHIDAESDLTYSEKVTADDGTVLYRMSMEDIKNTCMTCAKRELTEEVGFDPFTELDITNENIVFGLEREQEPDEVGQVHVCISIKVNLNEERLAAFFEKAKAQETEIEDLKSVAIDVEKFTGSFNVENAMAYMNSQLEKDLNLEKWSVLVIDSMLIQLIDFLSRNWNFKAVMEAIIDDIKEKSEQAAKEPEDVVAKEAVSETLPATDAPADAVLTISPPGEVQHQSV